MAYTQLTETERYPISSLREAGFSQLFISEQEIFSDGLFSLRQ